MFKLLLTVILLISSLSTLASPPVINTQSYIDDIVTNPEQTFYELQAQLEVGLKPQEKAKLQVILAEVAYFVDRSEHILSYVKEAMSSGLLDDYWHARALVIKARGHYQRREDELYLITAQMAFKKAKQINTPAIETGALIELILANLILEKDQQLKANMILVDKYLSFLHDGFNKAILLERYTSILSRLGNYADAIKILDQTIVLFKELKSPHFISISFYNQGRIEQQQMNFSKAAQAMELSYRWALKDENFLNQAFSLSRLAEYQEKLAQIKQAKNSLELAKDSAIKAQSSRVQLLTLKNIAEFSCRNESAANCYQYSNDAIEHAKVHDLVKDRAELQRYLAKQYYENKAYQLAYETLELSISK